VECRKDEIEIESQARLDPSEDMPLPPTKCLGVHVAQDRLKVGGEGGFYSI
jgi:hypothetical protein